MIEPTWESDCGTVRLWLGDMDDVLRSWSDAEEIAVVTDPPYGILNLDGNNNTTRKSPRSAGSGKLASRILNRSAFRWDAQPMSADQFDLLCRVGKEVVVWGGNYFALPPCRGVLVWDKMQPWENFSQVEIAWTNLDVPAKLFRHSNAFLKQHPTQKLVGLMAWCIGFTTSKIIADTFMGSGTTGVAAIYLGRQFWGIEIDPDYFEIAKRRIQNELKKQRDGFGLPAQTAAKTKEKPTLLPDLQKKCKRKT